MKNTIWKTIVTYLFVLFLLSVSSDAFSQITIKSFNAGWNKSNGVDWLGKLKDVKTISYVDVAKDVNAQKKYKIAAVPTIIIFKDGEEVARFQADLSFTMVATREEVQEEIDNILMSDF
tara:strand:+ start:530 stop:886 length:357 start_codon:yes stop_codon:yes gene_type:complete